MPRPTYSRERAAGGIVAGIDEAGRGPLAGPVVAAAVVLPARRWPPGLNDSKQLPADVRVALHGRLLRCATIGVGVASVEEIDRLNIYHATMLAMRRAVDALPVEPTLLLIDGNGDPHCVRRGVQIARQLVVRGDALSLSIAAASIVAKVTRDRMMDELAALHPDYGWESNRGYGTPPHHAALRRLGPSPHHRRSFRAVAACCEAGLPFDPPSPPATPPDALAATAGFGLRLAGA